MWLWLVRYIGRLTRETASLTKFWIFWTHTHIPTSPIRVKCHVQEWTWCTLCGKISPRLMYHVPDEVPEFKIWLEFHIFNIVRRLDSDSAYTVWSFRKRDGQKKTKCLQAACAVGAEPYSPWRWRRYEWNRSGLYHFCISITFRIRSIVSPPSKTQAWGKAHVGLTSLARKFLKAWKQHDNAHRSPENFVRSMQGLHPFGGDYVLKCRTV